MGGSGSPVALKPRARGGAMDEEWAALAVCAGQHEEACEDGPGPMVACAASSARRVSNERRRPLTLRRRGVTPGESIEVPAAAHANASPPAGLGLRGRTGALGGLLALVGELQGEVLRDRGRNKLEPPPQRLPASPRGLPVCRGRLGGRPLTASEAVAAGSIDGLCGSIENEWAAVDTLEESAEEYEWLADDGSADELEE